MRKIIIAILLACIMLMGITGCNKKIEESDKKTQDEYFEELVHCIENELDTYIDFDKNNLIDISLDQIKTTDKEKIAYFKGAFSSNNVDNKYLIVFPKNGTYDFYVMKDFDKYFYDQFSVYQKSDISSVTIYIHTEENDIDLKSISNKCIPKQNTKDIKSIPSKTLYKLNNTSEIIVKYNQKQLGTITNKDKIKNILETISSSKKYGDAYLCDGNGFEFEMIDNNKKLIDTILVWGDGKRLIPSSIHNGCSYYQISNEIDLRKIIEEETDFIFYNILNFTSDTNNKKQLIYEDDKYNYFINSENDNEVLVRFILNNKIMSIKYALENNYIFIEKLINENPEIFLKEAK